MSGVPTKVRAARIRGGAGQNLNMAGYARGIMHSYNTIGSISRRGIGRPKCPPLPVVEENSLEPEPDPEPESAGNSGSTGSGDQFSSGQGSGSG